MQALKNAILDETEFGNEAMRYEPFRPDVLKALRAEKGIKTQKDLAAQSGVPLDTIKRIESGQFKPSYETMLQLGSFFGLYFYVEWEKGDRA